MLEGKKVYLTVKLNEVSLANARNASADTVVCLERNISSDLKEIPDIISADSYRVDGSWRSYDYNTRILESLLKKLPAAFTLHGYDTEPALRKILYWSNYKTGSLYAALEAFKQPFTVLNSVDYFNKNKLKELLRYFKKAGSKFLKGKPEYVLASSVNIRGEIGVLLNNDFEFELYEDIIGRLSGSALIVFHYGNLSKASLDSLTEMKICCSDLSLIHSDERFKPINPFVLNAEELSAYNIISEKSQGLATELLRYQSIRQSGVKKLLFNVAENIPERNLMHLVFEKQITTYNTMNGMKAGEAQDADVYFDKWFVWDEQMKDMMIRKCSLNPEMLIVSGHLSQDKIGRWTYQETFGDMYQTDKKIISVFSVRGNRDEKSDVFSLLYQLLEEDDSFILLVKPHPLESDSDFIYPEEHIRNKVHFVDEKYRNSKESLFDQLLISDLSIVFSSTVALESKWMGTPCITVEYTDSSLIYCAESTEISHVKDLQDLKNKIIKLNKKPQFQRKTTNVSQYICGQLKTENVVFENRKHM